MCKLRESILHLESVEGMDGEGGGVLFKKENSVSELERDCGEQGRRLKVEEGLGSECLERVGIEEDYRRGSSSET